LDASRASRLAAIDGLLAIGARPAARLDDLGNYVLQAS